MDAHLSQLLLAQPAWLMGALPTMPTFTMAAQSPPIPGAGLHPADWLVLAAYIVVLVLAGWWAARRSRASSASDYFLAGRHMPVWAIAISMLATAQSAATFIGVPQDAYDGSLTYLSASLGSVLAAVLLAACVIPAYYRAGVSTPYQLLTSAFGPSIKLAACVAYLIGRVFASGARIYVGAIPLMLVIAPPGPDGQVSTLALCGVIAAFMVFAVLYTLRGGLASVIWTDIVQVIVYVGAAAVALIVLLRLIPGDLSSLLDALRSPAAGGGSKLELVRVGLASDAPPVAEGARPLTTFLGVDLTSPFTLITALTGWTLLNLAAFGTDQDLVQRLLTCKDARRGSLSTVASALVSLPVVFLFACVGLLLYVFYNEPGLMGRPTPGYAAGDSAQIFLKFALYELPAGAAGLIFAGVIAAGPAGVNASLNSMASTFIADVYRPHLAPKRDESHYVVAGRWAVAFFGVVLGAFAILCVFWRQASGENVITFVLGVMAFAYAGLLAIFFTTLFTRRGSPVSCLAALATGFLVVLVLQPTVWPIVTSWTNWTQEHLSSIRLAAPWRLTLATLLATGVCLLGSRRRENATG